MLCPFRACWVLPNDLVIALGREGPVSYVIDRYVICGKVLVRLAVGSEAIRGQVSVAVVLRQFGVCSGEIYVASGELGLPFGGVAGFLHSLLLAAGLR